MKYLYDYHKLRPQEDAIKVANRFGQDGYRWINADAIQNRFALSRAADFNMVFEKAVSA